MEELIQHYRNDADGLCCKLTLVCPKFKASTTVGLSGSTKDEWEIEDSSIYLKKLLEHGQFGDMWEGIWNGVTPVAVKVASTAANEYFVAEVQFMKKLQHRKLIQLYAICTTGEHMYIVTELMKNGNLLDYLQKV